MGTLSLTDPVNGTTADATLIATNNAAIKTTVNGGIDNSNISSSAAIALSKLASTIVPAPTTATSLPGSPVDLQQTILVDSTSAPTYAWLLQYSTAVAKWLFLGGSPLFVTGTSSTLSATFPRAGDYTVSWSADATMSSTFWQDVLSVSAGSISGQAAGQVTGSGNRATLSGRFEAIGVTAAATVSHAITSTSLITAVTTSLTPRWVT